MLTYFITASIAILVFLFVFRKKATEKKFAIGFYVFLISLIAIIGTNIVRLNTLETKVEITDVVDYEKIKVSTDYYYLFHREVVMPDSTKGFVVDTLFSKGKKLDTTGYEKKLYKNHYKSILFDSTFFELQFSDNEDLTKRDYKDYMLKIGNVKLPKRVQIKERYIGDKWTNSLGLPYKEEFQIIILPKSYKSLPDSILNQFDKTEKYEKIFDRYKKELN